MFMVYNCVLCINFQLAPSLLGHHVYHLGGESWCTLPHCSKLVWFAAGAVGTSGWMQGYFEAILSACKGSHGRHPPLYCLTLLVEIDSSG